MSRIERRRLQVRILAFFVLFGVLGLCGLVLVETKLQAKAVQQTIKEEDRTRTDRVLELGRELTPTSGGSSISAENSKIVDRWFANVAPSSEETYTRAGMITDRLTWSRENLFYWKQLFDRVGIGPDIGQQYATAKVSGSIRVLAISDSNLAGHGVADLETLWANRLETELNRRTSPGTFEVRVLAKGGASLMEYSEWVDTGIVESYDPDVVLVGYAENDPMPSGAEKALCGDKWICETGNARTFPAYRACMSGKGSPFATLIKTGLGSWFPQITDTLLTRYCDVTRLAGDVGALSEKLVITKPSANPYLKFFVDAAQNIRTTVGDRPLLLVRTISTSAKEKESRDYIDILRSAGFDVIDMPRTSKVLEQYRNNFEAMMVNPADSHPNALKTFAYASDVADKLLELFPNVQPTSARTQGLDATKTSLLSGYLPNELLIDGDVGTDFRMVLPPTSEMRVTESVDPSGVARIQSVPCAFTGRPHLRVIFDTAGHDGVRIRVGLERSGSPLTFQTSGYDSAGQELRSQEQVIRPGGSVEFTISDQTSNLLLGTLKAGCKLDQNITMDPTQIRITRISN